MIFAVTGANGFLGVHIIHHLLSKGHIVKAIVRPGASLEEFKDVSKFYNRSQKELINLEWHHCELYDILGLQVIFEDADYVVHLAGMISYLQKDLDTMMKVNQDYTANVVNVALDAGVSKMLYCSSIAAITKNDKGDHLTEDVEWNNEVAHSNYGYTKHLGEYELWRGKEEGLDTIAINPGIILGFGDWNKGSNRLFKNAKTSFPFYSEGITGWVGVEDVATVVELLCLSDISGKRFILVSENKSFKEIADAMSDALGTKRSRIEIKGLLYMLTYAIVSIKEVLGLGGMLSKETVRSSVAVNYFENARIKAVLNFEFEDMKSVIQNATAGYKKSL